MANALFTPAKEGLLDGSLDLDTATIKAVLVRSYTFSASHKFLTDVTGAGGVLAGTPQTLAGKTVTGGVFDANDVTFTAVAANASGHSVLVYQTSAAAGGADLATSAQRLIGYYDTGTLLPVTPNGGDITVAWDSGANRIFAIS